MPKDTGGVKPPLIGKFTGRLKTPLSIIAGFFALGVIADIIMEFLARHIGALQGRLKLGFDFWMRADISEEARQSIAYDDLILLVATFLILLVYKISWKKRLYATVGFFFGWYASSMWFSPRLPWEKLNESSSATKGIGQSGF